MTTLPPHAQDDKPSDHSQRGEVFIYGLYCPVSEEIRYVGKSVNPHERFKRHLYSSVEDTHKARWIRSLADIGLAPSLIILESTEQEEWERCEKEWISKLKSMGMSLTNETLGGEGREQGWTHKESAREKISSGLKKRSKSVREQAAKKTSEKLQGVPFTEQHRQNLRSSIKKAWENPSDRQKQHVMKYLGRPWTDKSKEKVSQTRTGKKRGKGTSQYLGVSWFKRDGNWRAWIKHEGKQIHLGYFTFEEDAARAYDRKALELRGDKATLNFPQSD